MRSFFVLACLAACGCGVGEEPEPALAQQDALVLPAVRRPVAPARRLTGLRQVSFQQEVAPLLSANCAGYCHGGAPPALAFETPSVASLLLPAQECADGRPRVTPGHPEPSKSYLIAKLRGQALCGNVPSMPPVGPPLAEGQIETLEEWIAEGAQDN